MRSSRFRNGAVSVRMFDPGTEWTLEQARELLAQGYSLAHVEARTGWPERMLLAGRRRSGRRSTLQ